MDDSYELLNRQNNFISIQHFDETNVHSRN